MTLLLQLCIYPLSLSLFLAVTIAISHSGSLSSPTPPPIPQRLLGKCACSEMTPLLVCFLSQRLNHPALFNTIPQSTGHGTAYILLNPFPITIIFIFSILHIRVLGHARRPIRLLRCTLNAKLAFAESIQYPA